MNISRRAAVAALSGSLMAPKLAFAAQAPVTIFEARSIITMEPSLPRARFVAVAGGMILGLANTRAELDMWTQGRDVREDRSLAKHILMPGLIDPHVHPMQAAVMLNLPYVAPEDWDLPGGSYRGAQTPAAYRTRLAEELVEKQRYTVRLLGTSSAIPRRNRPGRA